MPAPMTMMSAVVAAIRAQLSLRAERSYLGPKRDVRQRDCFVASLLATTELVEPRAVALGGEPLALLGVGADLLGDDAAERWPLTARDMLLRVPKVGADQRLAAVKIDLLGGHQDAAARHLAVDRERLQQRRVGRDPGAAVDPQ